LRSLELRLPPLLVWGLLAAAGYGVSRAFPALSFELPGTALAAGILAVLGAAIAVAGVVAFRRAGTTVHPQRPGEASAIVSGGVYRWTRNPMYLGFLLALAGWAVFLANPAALVALPAFVAYMNRFQIGPEERVLLTQFGASYAAYCAAVRRWI
jgi:protein-S-isoprenylcysteine O-methyltransferase Ste14